MYQTRRGTRWPRYPASRPRSGGTGGTTSASSTRQTLMPYDSSGLRLAGEAGMDHKPETPSIRLAVPTDSDAIVALRWKLLVATGRDEDTATRSTYALDYGGWLRKAIESGSYIGWLGVTAQD